MFSTRSRRTPTCGVTYVSLGDCTLHFGTEYIVERRDGSLAHMSMRTSVDKRETLQRPIKNCIDDWYPQVSVCHSQERPATFS